VLDSEDAALLAHSREHNEVVLELSGG
jgi:hypothetical protein